VIPAAYRRQAREEIREPSDIRALVGSQVIIRGHGGPAGMSATVAATTAHIGAVEDGWEVTIPMPTTPALLRLEDGDTTHPAGGAAPAPRQRLLTLVPITDAPPTVELLEPVRDSVMRRGSGRLVFRARATDDIGLDDGYFEVIITAGDEDEGGVHGRTVAIARRSFGDVRFGALDGSVDLDSLGLVPGSVLSIRAVARDGNTVSGPGLGASETRTFRIARADEFDSVAVESAAPSRADSSALSERVVIMATTRLIARMTHPPPITGDSLRRASQRVADQQEAVRGAVTAVMTANDEMELPIADVLTAPERALLDSASYAMGEASAALTASALQRALPSERKALAMLDSARALARRLYLRSRPPRLLVDVGRVRLSGPDRPDPAPRTPGASADTLTARWLARIVEVNRNLSSPDDTPSARSTNARRAAAVDSLVVLRVEALASNARLAVALSGAIDAIRAGGDPALALGHVRALLALPSTAASGLRADEWGP